MSFRKAMRGGTVEIARRHLGRRLGWRPIERPDPGYSIVLGVPWLLRDLLHVNLRFVQRLQRENMRAFHVIFDRLERPEAHALIQDTQESFPELPLTFHFYPSSVGKTVERLNGANFYCSTSWALGLAQCRTQHAIIHDFDLYPLRESYFEAIYADLSERALCFGGPELTHSDGLTVDDRCIGSWALGVDVAWLRSQYRARDVFFCYRRHRGKLTQLDPFSWLQLRTPERDLTRGLSVDSYCHVRNLPSFHLALASGASRRVVWRLHFLWYLQSLAGSDESMLAATQAMTASDSTELEMTGFSVDFRGIDATCRHVLREDVERLDRFLHGWVRDETAAFLDASDAFFKRCAKDGVA